MTERVGNSNQSGH